MIEIHVASTENSEKKSEFKMGFEPMTLCDQWWLVASLICLSVAV